MRDSVQLDWDDFVVKVAKKMGSKMKDLVNYQYHDPFKKQRRERVREFLVDYSKVVTPEFFDQHEAILSELLYNKKSQAQGISPPVDRAGQESQIIQVMR